MNSNQTNSTRSTEELKKQVLSDIDKVKQDFHEIKQRMTPGQLIDDAIFYRRGSLSPGEVFAHLKANPVGTSFLTLGTLLLMEDKELHTYESLAQEKVVQLKDRAKETGARVSERVSEKVEQGKRKLSETKDQLRSSIDSAKENLASRKEATGENLSEMQDAIQAMNPLTYMALGAGLGVITGSAIPVMETEKEVFDSRFSERLNSFTQELQDALNQSVNVLKNEVMGDLTNLDLDLFKT